MIFWIDFFSVLGLALLAVPTLRLNKLKRQQTEAHQKAKQSQNKEQGDLIADVAEVLVRKRGEEVAVWRMRDQVCLFSGYLFLLGASVVRLIHNAIIG